MDGERAIAFQETKLFHIDGLWCASCATAVQLHLQHRFSLACSVDLASQSLLLAEEVDAKRKATLTESLQSMGYRLSDFFDLGEQQRQQALTDQKSLRHLAVLLFSSFWVMSFSLAAYFSESIGVATADLWWWNGLAWLLAVPGLSYGAFPIYWMAWGSLRRRQSSVEALVTLGVIACVSLSVQALMLGRAENYLDSAMMSLSLFSLLRYFERKIFTWQRQQGFLSELDREAKVLVVGGDGQLIEKNLGQVRSGKVLRFKAGDKVVVDGEIIAGRGQLSFAKFFGEEDLRELGAGSKIHTGCSLVAGSIDVKVEKSLGQRWVDEALREKVLRHHQNSQAATKNKTTQYLAQAAPVLLIASLSLFLVSLFVLQLSLEAAIFRSLALVLVFCPCVFYITRPLLYLSLYRQLRQKGVLLRSPEALSNFHQLDTYFFDKTGTLSHGDFDIVLERNFSKKSDTEIWRIVGGLEQDIVHPVASAVARRLRQFALQPLRLRGKFCPSQGVYSEGPQTIFFGKGSWQHQGAGLDEKLLLSEGGKLLAVFRIDQRQRQSLREDLSRLAKNKKLYLITGDNAANTESFLEKIGFSFTAVFSGASFRDKADIVKSLQKTSRGSVFIGDGDNDILAARIVDYSLAVANASLLYRSIADIEIPEFRLSYLQVLEEAASGFSQRIRQNYVFALLYNVCALILAASGYFGPAGAIASMAVSSLLILANSLRPFSRLSL